MTRVLLLHPLGTDHRCWDLKDLDTLAVDLPGHGSTPCLPPGSGVRDFAEAVAGDWTGERVHVVGVSLGGLVAQHLAVEYPEIVERLVLVDTVATYPEPMRAMWRDRVHVARSRGLVELADPMATMWFTEAFLTGPVPARIREVFLAMDPEGYARACEALATADTTSIAPAITAPTLVICGSSDLPPFTEAANWLHDNIPDARLSWLAGKHAAFLEDRYTFAAELHRFLTPTQETHTRAEGARSR